MRMKFSFYFSVVITGLLLNGCSSNNVKPETNQVANSTNTTKRVVSKPVSITKPKVVQKRVVVKKVKPRPRPRAVVKPRYVKKNRVRRSNSQYKRRAVINKRYRPQRKTAHRKYVAKKYTPRKYVARRKYTPRKYVARKKYTPRKYVARRKYTPRKKYVAKRYVARKYTPRKRSTYRRPPVRRITPYYPPRRRGNSSFAKALSNAAVGRTRQHVRYDGKYVNIRYPWGDVPSNIGVCTDVVIRSYRRLGIDLQKEVHEDMANGGFYDYPNIRKWGLSAPDKNIDHRRVYNLQAFFRRHGAQLPISHNPTDYKPGDLVTWMVGPSLPHIGIVVEQRSNADPRRHMIVHNIANGPQMEDILFRFRITGHYRYTKNNRLIAPRRYARKNNIGGADYQRLMRELSSPRAPSRRRQQARPRISVARSGISDADIRAVLGR